MLTRSKVEVLAYLIALVSASLFIVTLRWCFLFTFDKVKYEGEELSRKELEGKLDESEPKKLFLGMPVIYVTAMTAKDLKAAGLNYGQFGPYNCAVYKYPKRNDRYLIFRLMLKTDEKNGFLILLTIC